MIRIVLILLAAIVPLAAKDRPPNVLVFLADDSGWGDYGSSGNTMVRTPAIDSLAADGARLERFFVCPVCSPTRAEFLTGRYYLRTGVRGVSTGEERLNLDETTIADSFRAAGYATGAFGKWHNGSQWPYHPNARGFSEYYGFTSGHWGEYFDPPLERNNQPVRGRGYVADDFAAQAADFIARHRDKPFFCYVPFNTPHSPWAAPAEDWARWREKEITQRGGADEKPEQTRCALAMMENLDANVGRVLRRVDELGLREHTIVVYFSDNGPNSPRWNGGMKGRKGGVDEGGVRSVCYLRWPGRIPAGTTVPQISGAIDLMPTLCALTGVKPTGTAPLDGLDLSPLLAGKPVQWPNRLIFSVFNKQASVRSQRHRLDAKGALFDMATDPGQARDISASEPAIAAELKAALAVWRAELPVENAKRWFPVGWREMPRTVLPARDGNGHGGVKRSAPAPNCSYFVNWTKPADSITWEIEVKTAGEYDVEILHTAAEAGATVELEFNGARTTGKVTEAWNPPLYTNQDTISRPPAESQMKEFRPLRLAPIRLAPGTGTLTLRATDIPGASVMDVRHVALTLR